MLRYVLWCALMLGGMKCQLGEFVLEINLSEWRVVDSDEKFIAGINMLLDLLSWFNGTFHFVIMHVSQTESSGITTS